MVKVKIGDTWYTPDDAPIMVQFAPKDLENVRNMAPGCDRYAVFSGAEAATAADKRAWMNEGYEGGGD